MLFQRRVLESIAAGRIDLAFRRWERARVRPGSRLRTAVGVLEVTSVRVVSAAQVGEGDARRAGFASRAALLAGLERGRPGRLHRVGLRFAGADPRAALRGSTKPAALDEVEARLAGMDARARTPWTGMVLDLIAARPGVRAADLAPLLGLAKLPFKARVRRLKELGLTESLEVGYRLSPRGRALRRRRARARTSSR